MPCFHCGKGIQYGRSHTHHRGVAGGRWKKRAPKTARIFEPNLQKMDVLVKGEELRVKVCTKCLKRVRKDITDGKRPFLNVIKYMPEKAVTAEAEKVVKKTKKAEKAAATA
jgi:ribosomal protein L28